MPQPPCPALSPIHPALSRNLSSVGGTLVALALILLRQTFDDSLSVTAASSPRPLALSAQLAQRLPPPVLPAAHVLIHLPSTTELFALAPPARAPLRVPPLFAAPLPSSSALSSSLQVPTLKLSAVHPSSLMPLAGPPVLQLPQSLSCHALQLLAEDWTCLQSSPH